MLFAESLGPAPVQPLLFLHYLWLPAATLLHPFGTSILTLRQPPATAVVLASAFDSYSFHPPARPPELFASGVTHCCNGGMKADSSFHFPIEERPSTLIFWGAMKAVCDGHEEAARSSPALSHSTTAAQERKQTPQQMLQMRVTVLAIAKITAASCKYLEMPMKHAKVWASRELKEAQRWVMWDSISGIHMPAGSKGQNTAVFWKNALRVRESTAWVWMEWELKNNTANMRGPWRVIHCISSPCSSQLCWSAHFHCFPLVFLFSSSLLPAMLLERIRSLIKQYINAYRIMHC